jgi:hypothetical protein
MRDSTAPDGPILLSEVSHSYERALSMLRTAQQPLDSLLLNKPLEIAAGGQTHRGLDAFGRNIFDSRRSDGYQVLLRWALSSGDAPQQADVDAANELAKAALASEETP